MTPELTVQQIAAAMGASWASGINLYATILAMGVMHNMGVVDLPDGIEYVSHPWVITAAGVMFFIEFFADKIPGLDSLWDGLHTFIRIPGAIVLAYGAAEGMGPVIQMASAILGGTLATTSHATKAGSRALINVSPEPFSNWTASILEDLAVIGGVFVALMYPAVFLVLLGIFILLAIWLLPRLWRGLRALWQRVRDLARGRPPPNAETPPQAPRYLEDRQTKETGQNS